MNPTRRDTPFREAMRSLLVFDGAMGSLLYERGVFVTQNFEQINVTRPEIVAKIHADYVAAGAQVLETNTFGANSFCLDRYGLGDQVRAYNVAGARLARKAAGEDVWVAGSIGPTGLVPGVASPAELDQVAATFADQAAALVEGGVDLFVLETFRHLEEIRIAIDAARRAAPGCPSSPRWPSTRARRWPTARRRSRSPPRCATGAPTSIGVNCGDGPQLALAIAERMRGGGNAALRAAQRRAAAYGRRPPPLYGHAGVPGRVRAPDYPARCHDDRRLLRDHARSRPLDGQVRAHARRPAR